MHHGDGGVGYCGGFGVRILLLLDNAYSYRRVNRVATPRHYPVERADFLLRGLRLALGRALSGSVRGAQCIARLVFVASRGTRSMLT